MTFNSNSGYNGFSRSVRSQQAIDSYEMPISMISRSVIDEFLLDSDDIYTADQLKSLKAFTVKIWKDTAKVTRRSSWHHTSSHYNRTNHYYLGDIAERLLDGRSVLAETKTTKSAPSVTYGVLTVQVWGGSRKRPVLEGEETVCGIVKGEWLYYKSYSIGPTKKLKTNANKVVLFDSSNNLNDLKKKHSTVRINEDILNNIIKEMQA